MKTMILLFTLGASLALVACSGNQAKSRTDLSKQVTGYHQHVRWGRFQQASSFLEIKDRGVFLGRFEEIGEDFRVVSVEIEDVRLIGDGSKAESDVTIEWLKEPSMTVHKDKLVETWQSFDGHWLLISQKFKKGSKSAKKKNSPFVFGHEDKGEKTESIEGEGRAKEAKE